jgi:hypothetical protein
MDGDIIPGVRHADGMDAQTDDDLFLDAVDHIVLEAQARRERGLLPLARPRASAARRASEEAAPHDCGGDSIHPPGPRVGTGDRTCSRPSSPKARHRALNGRQRSP